MKKTLLLAGVACLLSAQAMAFDINPYVSAKLKYSIMDNSWNSNEMDETSLGIWHFNNNLDADDKVFGGSIALGLRTPVSLGAVRMEIEYARNGDAKKSHTNKDDEKFDITLKNQTLLFNAYYDFNTNTAFTPYIGAGLGVARLKGTMNWVEDIDDGSSISSGKSRTNFAWQIGAGVAYNINENVAVDLGYRYIDYGKLSKSSSEEYDWGDITISNKVESKAHEIMLGLRYTF
jgi:opacity protein-like surface antigen